MKNALLEKARRRIKRLIKTGKKQARVSTKDGHFLYTAQHHSNILGFKLDSIGRLIKT
jgi:hypothetical protein